MNEIPPIIPKDSRYSGFYSSTDEKAIAGVCGGLAHKLKIPTAGLQVSFILVGFFFLAGVLAYVICWLTFPALPTKGVPRF